MKDIKNLASSIRGKWMNGILAWCALSCVWNLMNLSLNLSKSIPWPPTFRTSICQLRNSISRATSAVALNIVVRHKQALPHGADRGGACCSSQTWKAHTQRCYSRWWGPTTGCSTWCKPASWSSLRWSVQRSYQWPVLVQLRRPLTRGWQSASCCCAAGRRSSSGCSGSRCLPRRALESTASRQSKYTGGISEDRMACTMYDCLRLCVVLCIVQAGSVPGTPNPQSVARPSNLFLVFVIVPCIYLWSCPGTTKSRNSQSMFVRSEGGCSRRGAHGPLHNPRGRHQERAGCGDR